METIKKLGKEIDEINNKLKDSKEEETKLETIKTEIAECKESLQKKEEQYEKMELRIKKIEEYETKLSEYNIKLEKYNRHKKCKEEETLITRGLSKAELMLKKINDAESLSLQNTIDGINNDMEEFITSFFGENCNANIITTKETKDKEKKTCVEVDFTRDGESVSIDSLSGGEYDRLALALFLSFKSRSGVILLDECLASLNSELVEDIVEKIREKMNDKLVIFTLHQANTGLFDHIIDLKEIEKEMCCNNI